MLKSDHTMTKAPPVSDSVFSTGLLPSTKCGETVIDTRRPISGWMILAGSWVWGPTMKYALESATLVTFAAFLAWSVKILVAWV